MKLFFALGAGDHDLSASARHAERRTAFATEIAVGLAILPFVLLKLEELAWLRGDLLISAQLLLTGVDIARKRAEGGCSKSRPSKRNGEKPPGGRGGEEEGDDPHGDRKPHEVLVEAVTSVAPLGPSRHFPSEIIPSVLHILPTSFGRFIAIIIARNFLGIMSHM